MKGASAEVTILSFFTRHDPFFHHEKFQLPLRPPSTFLGVFWNCWQILSSKIFLIFFLCKIWVIAAPNKHFLGVWYQKWMRNKLLLLHFFSTFLNCQRATLTYSALGGKLSVQKDSFLHFFWVFCFTKFIDMLDLLTESIKARVFAEKATETRSK